MTEARTAPFLAITFGAVAASGCYSHHDPSEEPYPLIDKAVFGTRWWHRGASDDDWVSFEPDRVHVTFEQRWLVVAEPTDWPDERTVRVTFPIVEHVKAPDDECGAVWPPCAFRDDGRTPWYYRRLASVDWSHGMIEHPVHGMVEGCEVPRSMQQAPPRDGGDGFALWTMHGDCEDPRLVEHLFEK